MSAVLTIQELFVFFAKAQTNEMNPVTQIVILIVRLLY